MQEPSDVIVNSFCLINAVQNFLHLTNSTNLLIYCALYREGISQEAHPYLICYYGDHFTTGIRGVKGSTFGGLQPHLPSNSPGLPNALSDAPSYPVRRPSSSYTLPWRYPYIISLWSLPSKTHELAGLLWPGTACIRMSCSEYGKPAHSDAGKMHLFRSRSSLK
jgi:hypothetical protein